MDSDYVDVAASMSVQTLLDNYKAFRNRAAQYKERHGIFAAPQAVSFSSGSIRGTCFDAGCAVVWCGPAQRHGQCRVCCRPIIGCRAVLWGTATAAYQIENTQNDDWAVFEKTCWQTIASQLAPGQAKPGHIHKLSDFPDEVLAKTDFDARLEDDLEITAAMKHNSFLFSISWSRLFPRPDMTDPDPMESLLPAPV